MLLTKADTVGIGATIMETVFVSTQFPTDPLRLYIAVAVGLTAIEKLVEPLGIHVKFNAPVANSVALSPAQSKLEVGKGLSDGLGKITTSAVFVSAQPRELVPITE